MSKPYYEQDGITIYHGDCREVLPALATDSFDLVLTDPPYPRLKGGTIITKPGLSRVVNPTVSVGTPWGDDISPLSDAWRVCRYGMLAFCSFHSVGTLPQVVGQDGIALVAWCQRNAPLPVNEVPHFQTEFVWAFKKAPGLRWRSLKTYYDIPRLAAGLCATERLVDANGCVLHPAQKPLALIGNLLQVGGESVLDPYCGTGTTLVAAKVNGRRAIGIEIEERYCEIAARRLGQGVLFGKETA